MHKTLALVATSIISLSVLTPSVAQASEELVPPHLGKAEVELLQQLKNRKTPPVKYWTEGVAICETNGNWKDKGNWAGGLGIAMQTWKGYGGFQFARRPDHATITEQIVIANRIAVFGFQTKHEYMTFEDRLANRPFFRPPAGFLGWGCIKNNQYLRPKHWIRRHGRA